MEVAAFMAPVAVLAGKNIAVTGETSRIWVESNAGALFQATRNLVENAIIHTASGTRWKSQWNRMGAWWCTMKAEESQPNNAT